MIRLRRPSYKTVFIRYLSSQDNSWNDNTLQLALLQIYFCSKGYRAAIAKSLSPPVAKYPGPKEPNLEESDSLAENNFWYHSDKEDAGFSC